MAKARRRRTIDVSRSAGGLLVAALIVAAFAAEHSQLSRNTDPALQPPLLQTSMEPQYADSKREFQGIPGIERAHNGRLWAVWYAGGTREGPENYVILATSADDGRTWSGPKLMIDPPGFVRAFDACLWHDPQGRLWLFWAQAAGHWDGRGGVWAVVTSDSDSERPRWSRPRRIADGVLMNKPITLSNGKWLLPIAVWTKPSNLAFINDRDKLNLSSDQVSALTHDLGKARGAGVVSSSDRGKTFRITGQPEFPDDNGPVEHMLIERQNGNIRMLARTRYGIGSTTSTDGGHTWSEPKHASITQPSTRFFIRRLRSGRLLLVKNSPPNGKDRSYLTAYVSHDEGETWNGGLVLDERMNVSYPDGVQAPNGKIYVVYDRERFTAREILISTFREEDVLAGKPQTEDAKFRMLVNQAGQP